MADDDNAERAGDGGEGDAEEAHQPEKEEEDDDDYDDDEQQLFAAVAADDGDTLKNENEHSDGQEIEEELVDEYPRPGLFSVLSRAENRPVSRKLLHFTILMIVFPIGVFLASQNYLMTALNVQPAAARLTYSGLLAIIAVKVVTTLYAVMAFREDAKDKESEREANTGLHGLENQDSLRVNGTSWPSGTALTTNTRTTTEEAETPTDGDDSNAKGHEASQLPSTSSHRRKSTEAAADDDDNDHNGSEQPPNKTMRARKRRGVAAKKAL